MIARTKIGVVYTKKLHPGKSFYKVVRENGELQEAHFILDGVGVKTTFNENCGIERQEHIFKYVREA